MRQRSIRLWGASLALFAVWLQLTLSLGHLHPEDVWGALGHPVFAGQSATQLTVDHTADRKSGDPDNPAAEAACAICAAVHFTATGALPDPVRLPEITLVGVAVLWTKTAFVLVARPFLFSRSRAPPIR